MFNLLSPRIISMAGNAGVVGKWFEIQFMLDLGIEERLNVGVAVIDGDGQIHSKLLDDTSRLRSLYGQHSAEMIAFLFRLLEEALRVREPLPPSPHLIFGRPRFAQGASVSAILDDAFAANVILARPMKAGRQRKVSRDTATVRRQVLAALRKIGGGRAERIIARQPVNVTDATGHVHALDLPLLGKGVCGSIVSGCYQSTAVSEANMLRASLELETAARVMQVTRRGLFVLRSGLIVPTGAVDAERWRDNRLERIEYQLRNLDVHVGVASHADHLAEEILTWSESA